MPMNLTLVTETFPPEVNGVAMTLDRLCRGLAGRGHRITVVRPRQGKGDRSEVRQGIIQQPTVGLPLPGYPGLRFGLPCARSLRRSWQQDRPDVVHIATEGPLGWSALRAARALGLGVSSSFHTNFHSYGRHYGVGAARRLALAWLRYFHNRTRLTLVPSEDLRQDLAGQGFERLAVLGRGVETSLFHPSRRDPELRRGWGAGSETPVAMYVGRVASEKNLPLTLEAWQRMRELRPDMRMVVVGDGPMAAALRQAHPEVHFAGLQQGEALARHYASGDLFLFASATETFGNVVTEAMASGLPVLSFAYAAPGRLIRHGQNGWVVPLGEREAFLEQAASLAERIDPAASGWSSIREAARDTVLPLSWDTIVGEFEDRLAGLIR